MRLPTLWGPGGQDPFTAMRREMDRLSEDFSHHAPGLLEGRQGGLLRPAMDVHETEKAPEVTAELPGVSDKDLEVRLENNVLTIRGEKREESRPERRNAHVVERSDGAFQRSPMLPVRADPGKVEAEFEHGVLRIRVPKPDEGQQVQRINVRSGGSSSGGQGGRAGEGGPSAGPGVSGG